MHIIWTVSTHAPFLPDAPLQPRQGMHVLSIIANPISVKKSNRNITGKYSLQFSVASLLLKDLVLHYLDGGRCKAGPWVKFFEPASVVPPQLSSPVRAFPQTISALAPSPLAFLVVQSVLTWCPCKNRSNTRGDFWPCQAAKGSINGFS